jgi:hypothetical protein
MFPVRKVKELDSLVLIHARPLGSEVQKQFNNFVEFWPELQGHVSLPGRPFAEPNRQSPPYITT